LRQRFEPLRFPYLHRRFEVLPLRTVVFFAFIASFLLHFFDALLKALRACFAVLNLVLLIVEITHFLNPGFARPTRREVLRPDLLLTICVCPGEDLLTQRPFDLWHLHVILIHRTEYTHSIYKKVFQKGFEFQMNLRLHVFNAREIALRAVFGLENIAFDI